jgi:hypothetical protein
MSEKNPFLKDYRDDIEQCIVDMDNVRVEVSRFLALRYGSEFRYGNMLMFLAVLTSEYLLYINAPYEKYEAILRLTYKYLKSLIESGQVRLTRDE